MNGSDRVGDARMTAGTQPARANRLADRGADIRATEVFPEFGEEQRRQFDASPHPMRISEHGTWRYLAVNDAALKLYGYTREEFLKLTLRDTRHPAEHAEQDASFALHTGFLRHSPSRRHVTRSGEIIVVEVVAQDILYGGVKARLGMTIDVTGRNHTHALLQDRERELAAILGHTPDIVARFDRDLRCLYVNPAVTHAIGKPPADFVGRCLDQLGIPAAELERWTMALREAFATGREQTLESAFRNPGGSRRYESRIVPERRPGGAVESVLVVTRDYTERRNAEELLWLRAQEFERLAENIPDLVARFDRHHRYVYVNTAVERALGISRHQMLGRTQRELGMPAELAATFESSLDEVLRTGDVHTLEFKVDTKHGERFMDAYHVPEGGMRHRVETVLCVARDITERKLVEVAQGRLAAIVNSSSDAIISKDLDGVIQTWNPGAARMFGYAAAEALGQPIAMLIPLERRPEEALIIERIRRGEPIEHFESVRLRKDGTRVQVSLTISPILGPAGRLIGASTIARDITERKLAELAVRRSAALAQLLESLARAANEAVSPQAAMVACLELICRHGRWAIGRAQLFGREGPGKAPGQSVWYAPERERFAAFIEFSNSRQTSLGNGFISGILRDRAPMWMEDIEKHDSHFGRREAALAHGLRSAFGFPIMVRGDVVAVIEMYCEEPRSQDPLTMGAAQSLASQLARIVERDWAHQAKAFVAAIVENSPDAIISRALGGTILTWNPGAERLLGYSAQEVIGRDIRLIIPPEFHERMRDREEQIARGGAVPGHETVRITKDGRAIHVATTSAPIKDAGGNMVAISTIIRDITQRKLREQQLRESEERFRQLAENIRQVFWICTPRLDRMVYMSGAYEEVWGRSRESVYRDARSWMDAIHPGDLPRVMEEVKSIARGELLDIEYRIVRPDGTERWIRDRSYPMKAGDGSMLACGLAEDITDQKRAEHELREAQQRLQVAVRGGGVGLWDWDLVRDTVYFSPEWKRQLGYEDHEVPNRFEEWKKRVHPDDHPRVSRQLHQFFGQPGTDYRAEFRLRHRDGSYRWILSRATALRGKTGEVERMVGCHVDVTEQKQFAAEQLEQAMSQRDALVREVHHRIKNSLQGVAGLLRQKIAKYPAIAPGMEEAIAQLQSVALVYGLQGTRSDGLLSLAEVTDAICSSAESLIGGKVEREFERSSLRSACLSGSEAVSVAVALNELVFNALKHQRAAAGKKRARVLLSETRSTAEIRISNRGRLPKEFDFDAGRSVGNGLGLVRALLVSPGGSIAFSGRRNEVEVVLTLSPPLLAERGKAAPR